MKQNVGKPQCPLCKSFWEKGLLFILCNVEGIERPVFVCGNCYIKNKKIKGRVRAI